MTSLAPIAMRWAVPTPACHGMVQRFRRLEGCPDYLLLDLSWPLEGIGASPTARAWVRRKLQGDGGTRSFRRRTAIAPRCNARRSRRCYHRPP